jgi:DNA repair protein RadA/Sms
MCFGAPGAGKTTFMLRMADAIASAGERVLFVSAEEGVGDSLRKKLRDMELFSDDLWFVPASTSADVLDVVEDKEISWVFVDSFNMIRWGLTDLEAIHRGGVGLCWSAHVVKDGSASGPMMLQHVCDVVLEVEALKWKQVKNRFGPLLEGGCRD